MGEPPDHWVRSFGLRLLLVSFGFLGVRAGGRHFEIALHVVQRADGLLEFSVVEERQLVVHIGRFRGPVERGFIEENRAGVIAGGQLFIGGGDVLLETFIEKPFASREGTAERARRGRPTARLRGDFIYAFLPRFAFSSASTIVFTTFTRACHL